MYILHKYIYQYTYHIYIKIIFYSNSYNNISFVYIMLYIL